MDYKFTEQIRLWFETPEAERDYATGALYLLKLSGTSKVKLHSQEMMLAQDGSPLAIKDARHGGRRVN